MRLFGKDVAGENTVPAKESDSEMKPLNCSSAFMLVLLPAISLT